MISFHINSWDLYFLPCIRLVKGSCLAEDCHGEHWELSISFLCFSVTFTTGVCEE